MNNYKPYSYLYKNINDPEKLKSCYVVMVPVGKKLTLRSGDPSTVGRKTTIKYNIETDASKTTRRQNEYNHEFDWDGNSHDVEVIVGDGSGDTGGKTVMGSDYAELD
jgi:hypothetical protein